MSRRTVPARSRAGAPERILYLLTDPMSTRLLRGQLAHLRAEGFEVQLGCRGGPVLDRFARDEGVVAHELPYVREPNPWRDLRALAATIRLIGRSRPGIVNASTPKAGVVGMVAAWCCRVPVRVYVVRGLRYETATGAPRRVLRALERLAVGCSTHTIFNSASLRAQAEADGVVRAGTGEVLGAGSGNGVDAARFDRPTDRDALRGRLGLAPDDVVIGFVGRFVQDKGFDDLVESFAAVADAHPQARLLLVGDYEDGDAVAAPVRAAVDEDPRIVRTGWVEDPAALYAAMDVLAFPSYREGLPNVPLEAQAAGVPVVAYAATGTVDAVRDGETGRLVPVGDRVAFAAALGELVADRSRAGEWGRAGSRWVAGAFAPDRVWTALADRYQAWSAAAAPGASRRSTSSQDEPVPADGGRSSHRTTGLDLRAVTPDDRPQVIDLLRRSMGWGDDPRFAELFAWKHDHNAFGPSPGWVACDGDRVVALRMFLRWEFVRDGEVLRAVRAVDTATHPDHRGRGLFRALTELGLEEMATEGVDFVFNTPNQQSRPGYLTMGWRDVGALPVSFRPSVPGLPRTLRARTAAGHWSLDDDSGRPVRDVLDESEHWGALAVAADGPPCRLRTRTSPAFLRWRYGGDVVRYRGLARDGSLVVFRHRRRGAAREAVIATTLGPDAAGPIEALRSATVADHLLRIGTPDVRRGWLPLPGGGPLLTHRPVSRPGTPPIENWSLDMGDVELF